MISAVASLASAVPGTRLTCIGASLILLQMSSAVAVHSGRVCNVAKPSSRAWRYRRASLVGRSAASSLPRYRNSLSAVVTMCSISELACASSNGKVLIRIAGFGSNAAACFSSATAARAVIHRFKTGFVSRSILGGSSGRSLYGRSECHAGQDVLSKVGFCDMF